MEDLGSTRFGDAAAGWSRSDARSVVEALASLHARWWNDRRLGEWKWLPRFGDARSQFERFIHRRGTFLDRYANELSDDLRNLTLSLTGRIVSSIHSLGGPPRTLLHVDTHSDNVTFVDDDGPVSAILFDWQGVAMGLGAVDLSSFLLGGTTEQRRACERDLIEHYHSRLVANGVTGYPLQRLRADYARAVLRWWVGTVNGLGSAYAAAWTGRRADMARDSVRRWNVISEDHGMLDRWLGGGG